MRDPLEQAADTNLATHFSWVQQRTPGMRAVNTPEITLTDCGLPCDTFNAACHVRFAREDAPQQIRDALAWFAESGHPFSWWVGPADQPKDLGVLLEAEGLVPAESELAMAVDLSSLQVIDRASSELDIRRVQTPPALMDYARINAANWSPPDPWVLRFYECAAPVVLASDSPLRYYVGYLQGEAVAAAELTVSRGAVGLYGVSTLEAYRRRGFGSALTLRPLLDARDEGHRIAILQAADAGVHLYQQIGFDTFGQITEYKPPAFAARP